MDIASIIQGYAHGYFLMADDRNQLGWYTSRKRALMPLDQRFHYPKSLRRILNQNRFTTAINRDFQAVCERCANRETTWISSDLMNVYLKLHHAGWAHSFETWYDGQLAGGILGIVIHGAFIGESMFYQVPDASKVAMVKLIEHLRQRNFLLFDAQLQNPHLARFGAYLVNDKDYNNLLQKALARNCVFI